MRDEEYFALEALSASGAKLLRKSPLHYWSERQSKKPPTPAMVFGTAVHRLALEPDSPAFCVKKLNWASKEGKAEREMLEATGLPILSEADASRAFAIRDALWADARIAGMLKGAETEVPLLWEQHGVKCKAKMDAIKGDAIIDLKTCIDASPRGFERAVAQFQYHMQAAHYFDGLAIARKTNVRDFLFIAIESQAPYAVAVYRLDAATLAAGKREMARAAALYKDCMAKGEWPGYAREVLTLTLPSWAMPALEWDDAA